MVLRPGSITPDMIRKVTGDLRMDPGLIEENSGVRPRAPGMKYKHYAPRAELILVSGAACPMPGAEKHSE